MDIVLDSIKHCIGYCILTNWDSLQKSNFCNISVEFFVFGTLSIEYRGFYKKGTLQERGRLTRRSCGFDRIEYGQDTRVPKFR
jgi:hypothetical protein